MCLSIYFITMKNKLNEIANLVAINLEKTITDFSLLAGNLGEILFLYYYSRCNKLFEEKADNAFERLLNEISSESNKYYQFSYCNGLAGLGIAMHLLEEADFIENDDNIWEDLDTLLSFNLKSTIREQNYDFLHGTIGIGFYFLKHSKCKPKQSIIQIKHIISYLENTSIKDAKQNQIKWIEIDKLQTEKLVTRYNISLSHGMSSIIIFLSRVIALNIIPEKQNNIINMLNQSVNYILSQELDYKVYGCYFPSMSLENKEPIIKSRLAWCYGDLGIAVALWHTGKTLKRQDCQDKAVEILKYAAVYRQNLQENYVFDAGICHGAAGIAQIFYRMAKETQLPELHDAYVYWNNKTLEIAKFPDGLAGYKAFDPQHNKWTNQSNILEGIAGIGLLLLSPIVPDWDEILLLNFK